MMRTLFILLLLCSPVLSFGQAPYNQYQGASNTIIINRGGVRVDSVLFIPERGDNGWYGQYGNIRINPNSKKLEYRNSIQWVTVAGNSGSTNFKQQEFPGAQNYTLSNIPLGGTVSVEIGGVQVPAAWLTIAGNVVSISVLPPFNFAIDSTDRITIKYFY